MLSVALNTVHLSLSSSAEGKTTLPGESSAGKSTAEITEAQARRMGLQLGQHLHLF